MAAGLGIECTECDLYPDDLKAVDEFMLTGTLKEVMPVIQVGETVIGGGKPGQMAARLREALRDYARGKAGSP